MHSKVRVALVALVICSLRVTPSHAYALQRSQPAIQPHAWEQAADHIDGRGAAASRDLLATSRSCRTGYSCKSVSEEVCAERRKKQPSLRHTVASRCSAYVVNIAFRFAYNGRRAQVLSHSLRCTVNLRSRLVRVSCHVENNGAANYGYVAVVAKVAASRKVTALSYDYTYYVDVYATTSGGVSVRSIMP